MIAAPEGSRLDQTPNFAEPARDGEVEEIEKLEISVVFDMDRIQSAVRPLASSYPLLTEINSQRRPGVLSFSQARVLELCMACIIPCIDLVSRYFFLFIFFVGV